MPQLEDMAAPVRAALREGYAPESVLTYLAENKGLQDQVREAMEAGHSARDVLGYLTGVRSAIPPLSEAARIDLNSRAPGSAGMPTPKQAARAFGVGTRDVIEGGVWPLTIAGDAAAALAGTKPASEMLASGLDRLGLPRAETSQERLVGDINRAGAGMMTGGALARALAAAAPGYETVRLIADIMTSNPRAQAVAGGAGALASGAAREEGWSPAAQMGAGIVGSVVAPGTGMQSATKAAGKTFVDPFTQAGRETIVGGVLRRLANDPDAAAANMGSAPEYVPGSRPTTATASRDFGLLAADTPIRGMDTSGAYGTRLSQNAEARRVALDRIARDEGAINRAIDKREAVAGRLRDQAFADAQARGATASAQTVSQAVDGILGSPAGKQEVVEKTMNWVKGRLQGMTDDAGGVDPQALYALRKDINLAIEGKLSGEQQGFRLARGQLLDVKRAIDAAIEAAAPGFKGYLTTYERMSRPIDQMTLLQDLRRRSLASIEDPRSGVEALMPGKFKQALRTLEGDIADTLTPQQRQIVDRIAADLDRSAATTAPGVKPPGSDTFRNMSVSNLIGTMIARDIGDNATLRTLSRGLSFIYRIPDEQLQRLLVDAMLDPRLAQQMMGRATTHSVERVGQMLKQKLGQTTSAAASSQSAQ